MKKYIIQIGLEQKITYSSSYEVKVEAETEEEAISLAKDEAYDSVFSETAYDWDVEDTDISISSVDILSEETIENVSSTRCKDTLDMFEDLKFKTINSSIDSDY